MEPPIVIPDTARLLADPALPPPVRRFLESGGRLERIVLSDQGQWSHEGEPFTNPALIGLFNRSLMQTAGGTWLLHIPPFSYPIELSDTPYYVRSARLADGAVVLGLSDDAEEPLQPATLRYVEGRGLYCRVKNGVVPGGFAARLLRPAYFVLADSMRPAGQGRDGYVLDLGPQQQTVVPVVTWEQARRRES
jgi:hypothetical protein